MSLHIKPIALLLYTFCVVVTATCMVLLYMLFAPVVVLQNWHITVRGSTHYPGESIEIDSYYTKLKDVTGTAHRYVDCKNKNGAYTRYEVSSAAANNQSGANRSTGILISLPPTIPTPTTCHVSILVIYQVNALRQQPEFATSGEFKLVARPKNSVSLVPVTPFQSTSTEDSPVGNSSDSQSSPSEPSGPPTAPDNPGILKQTLNIVNDLIQGVLHL